MKILMTASEMAPFAKVGGLGDVIGSLPMALSGLGHDVRVMIPLYKVIPPQYREQLQNECVFEVQMGWRKQYCGIYSLLYKGVMIYFVDNQFYFGWDRVYGYMEEEAERFCFFNRVVLESLKHLDFYPEIIHCNDWQTGMIPVLLRTQYTHGLYKNIKTVMTIHNLRYQGIYEYRRVADLLALDVSLMTNDKLEFFGETNFLKAGIVYAQQVTTVSPTYATETCEPFWGEKLDGVLRSRGSDYTGIINGIDQDEWNPESDMGLRSRYTVDNLRGKARNKEAVQEELWLEKKPHAPLMAVITRLVAQKGLDLMRHVFYELLIRQPELQLAVLGTGEAEYEEFFRQINGHFPGRVSVTLSYNNDLAHRLYAGADMLLVPSAFEPCGLTQLIALKYGTLPIVRETGGLKDTVVSYNEYTRKGNGFSFAPYNAHDMMFTIERALSFYNNPRIWKAIMRVAMRQDFSWELSAKAYEEVYKKAARE